MTGPLRLACVVAAASLAAAAPLPAQTTDAASPTGLPAVPITRVLAVGRGTANWTPEAIRTVMPREVRATVALYLRGKVTQWYVRKDQPGVVFVFDSADVGEVHDLLEGLPLGRAKMMAFDLIPLGPLAPLGLLVGSAETSTPHPFEKR